MLNEIEKSNQMTILQKKIDDKLSKLDGKDSKTWYNMNKNLINTNLCKDAIDFRMSMLDSTLNKYILDFTDIYYFRRTLYCRDRCIIKDDKESNDKDLIEKLYKDLYEKIQTLNIIRGQDDYDNVLKLIQSFIQTRL